MDRIQEHSHADGSMDEQMDRNTGINKSARDLTWSYSAFITATWAKD